MNGKNFLALIATTTLFCAACGGTETGIDPVDTNGSVNLRTTDVGSENSNGALDGGTRNAETPDMGTSSDDASTPVEDTGGDPPDMTVATGVTDPPFDQVATFQTTISGNDADVYYPNPPDLGTGSYSFPLALFLQGAEVDKANYSSFASKLASFGFVVVVPNREGFLGLYPQTNQVTETLSHMQSDPGAVGSALDTSTMIVLGHSYGGVAGIYAVEDECPFQFCTGGYTRPAALKGGVFFGTNMKPPFGNIPAVANDGLAVALIQGTLDGNADPADTQETYDKMQDPPKALVEIAGVNHYGITDTNNPNGAAPDSSTPTLDQATSVDTIATWAALYIKGLMLAESEAKTWIEQTGAAEDANVTITFEH